jgi:hypothetical protein
VLKEFGRKVSIMADSCGISKRETYENLEAPRI